MKLLAVCISFRHPRYFPCRCLKNFPVKKTLPPSAKHSCGRPCLCCL